MPRKPRFILPGQPQHVIIRGVNREPIFYHKIDYYYYLKRLNESFDRHGCALHAYVLMTNHVHLLLTPTTEQSIGKAIQTLGRYYVQYFNASYQRTGTLWEGRYKSSLVDTVQYLLPVTAILSSTRYGPTWSLVPVNTPGPVITAMVSDKKTRSSRHMMCTRNWVTTASKDARPIGPCSNFK